MIIARISIIIVVLVSCGSKHREPQDDGKIIQKSNDKIPSHRLWFSIEAGSSDNNYKLIYEGRESVMSFAIVNHNSIPAEVQNEYSKVELLGLWKHIKYQLFSLNLFNASSIPYSEKKSEFHPEYLTITSPKFFFDIPKIDRFKFNKLHQDNLIIEQRGNVNPPFRG